MAYEENLRAIISGDTGKLQSSLTKVKKKLEKVADNADDAGDNLSGFATKVEGAQGATESFEDTIGDVAKHLRSAARAADKFGEESGETAKDSVAAATAAGRASSAIDEVGDQASSSTAKLSAFNAALQATSGASLLDAVGSDVDIQAPDTDIAEGIGRDKAGRVVNPFASQSEDGSLDDILSGDLNMLNEAFRRGGSPGQVHPLYGGGDRRQYPDPELASSLKSLARMGEILDSYPAFGGESEYGSGRPNGAFRGTRGAVSSVSGSEDGDDNEDYEPLESFLNSIQRIAGVPIPGAAVADGSGKNADYSTLREAGELFNTGPNIKIAAGQSVDDLTDNLYEARQEAASFTSQLGDVEGIDEMIRKTKSVDALLGDLAKQGEGELASNLQTGEDENRSTVSIMERELRTSGSYEEFEANVTSTGKRLDEYVTKLNGVDDAVRDVADEQVETAKSTNTVGERFRSASDDADEYQKKLKGVRGILGSIFEDSSFRLDLGPVNVKLDNLYALFTLIYGVGVTLVGVLGALGAAIGAIGTAAAGLGGVLGGVLMGGLMEMGQQRADMDPSDDIETMSDGMDKVMEDFGARAAEAMAPLRNQETISFTQDMMAGGLTQLNRLAHLAADLFDEMQPLIDSLAGTWWQTEPYILQEMQKTILALQPELKALIGGAIRAIPAIFAYMRGEGAALLDTLMAFTGTVIDLVPTIASLASVIMRLFLPLLTIWQGAVDMLAPVLYVLAQALGVVADILLWIATNPLAQALLGVKLLLTWISVISGFITSVVLPALGGMSLSLLGVAGALRTVGAAVYSALGPFGLALAFILAFIDYFGLWDEIIEGLQKTWNLFVGAIVWGLKGLVSLLGDVAGFFGINLGTEGLENDIEKFGESMKVDADGDMGPASSGGKGGQGYQTGQPPMTVDQSNSTFVGGDAVKKAAKEAAQEARDEQLKQTSPFAP